MAKKKTAKKQPAVSDEVRGRKKEPAADGENTSKEFMVEISRLRKLVTEKTLDYKGNKNTTKKMKEDLNNTVKLLMETIDRYNKKLPLFDGKDDTERH